MISDGRIAALVVLSKQIETECRDALQGSTEAERHDLLIAVRNITSARKTLERVSSGRLQQHVAQTRA